ncbi:hypothetical protein WJR50_32900 [Catalinimonas sp. 4WD22]|uniref:hypothetical protein n=1 Tax=Catalinimonas locisalis TaxID=3133978 RepID=UPI0031016133
MTIEEEYKILMAIEQAFLPEFPHILSPGSKPGYFKAKATWGGKTCPGQVPVQYQKPEFTEEDLKRWGVTHYIVWG